ncbi:MAG: hypothetical protein QXE34_01635 [Candidatus Aenigmatarchaeota archaeon]
MNVIDYLDLIRNDFYTKVRTAVGGSIVLDLTMEVLRSPYAQRFIGNILPPNAKIDLSAAFVVISPFVLYVADAIGAFLTAYSVPAINFIRESLRWIASKEFNYSFGEEIRKATEMLRNEAESIKAGSFDDAFGGAVLFFLCHFLGRIDTLYELNLFYRLLALGGLSAISDIVGDATRYLLKLLGMLGENLDKMSRYERYRKAYEQSPQPQTLQSPQVPEQSPQPQTLQSPQVPEQSPQPQTLQSPQVPERLVYVLRRLRYERPDAFEEALRKIKKESFYNELERLLKEKSNENI